MWLELQITLNSSPEARMRMLSVCFPHEYVMSIAGGAGTSPSQGIHDRNAFFFLFGK
jgi:hypothetical protein